jgi:pyrimidine deaminase RibD-like protein
MPDERPGSPFEILLAKLRALRTPVAHRLADPRAKYFDPEVVLESFAKYSALAAGIRECRRDLFGDLPERTAPQSSGTSDYDGRGYVERRHVQRLLEDLDYILEVAAHASAVGSTSSVEQVDRRFMELAVAEAAKSSPEAGRLSPKVGAVIARGADLIATAYRGEQKQGEHAEYTALEGKCNELALAGATVYTTLEPCTARNQPKTPCVDRLIARKVSRVVIGMLDPNELIRGRGILILRRANIEVGLFPPDLMSRLEEMNRDFISDHEGTRDAAARPSSSEPVEDKWVSTAYVESSGIGVQLKAEGFALCWVGADTEAEHVDLQGWQHVTHEQGGKRFHLKVHDASVGGYLVLLKRRTSHDVAAGSPRPKADPLSEKASILLRTIAASEDGLLARIRTLHGIRILANSSVFSEGELPAVQAEWDEAIGDLLRRGLITEEERGKIFFLTAAGYRAASDAAESVANQALNPTGLRPAG